ncbi:MAG TPA: hypothetical protein VGG98_04905 [Solirubrobacteraceae bacterium]
MKEKGPGKCEQEWMNPDGGHLDANLKISPLRRRVGAVTLSSQPARWPSWCSGAARTYPAGPAREGRRRKEDGLCGGREGQPLHWHPIQGEVAEWLKALAC